MSTLNLPDFPPRLDTEIVRPFWDALERGELRLPACSKCKKWQWYPYEFIKCHENAHHEWTPVPTKGSVFTFTTVHRGFLPNADPGALPYTVALVELDGIQDLRLAAYLINLGSHKPRVGMPVRLSPVRQSTYVAPAFMPDE